MLDVAKRYTDEFRDAKGRNAECAAEVFQELHSKYKKEYFKRCQKLAKKFSFECMGAVILQELNDGRYHIIDGTRRLVVYAVRLRLEDKGKYRKVECVVYKKEK